MKRLYARFVMWLIRPAFELRGPAKVINNIRFENGTDRAVFNQVVKLASEQMIDELRRRGELRQGL